MVNSKIHIDEEKLNKLIYMCDDLYPNFKIEIKTIEDDFFIIVKNDDFIIEKHWFEFCIVDLPEILSENSNTVYPKEKNEFLVDMMLKKMLNYSTMQKSHPIEFLFDYYNKFVIK